MTKNLWLGEQIMSQTLDSALPVVVQNDIYKS